MTVQAVQPKRSDTVIVGGGPAGLAAATYLARAGQSVTLYEQASETGGRARSFEQAGYQLNLGAHALYRAGAGVRVLRELGVAFSGGVPPQSGPALRDGQVYPLPGSPLATLTTRLLSAPAKLELAAFMLRLGRIEPRAFDRMTIAEWLANHVRHADLRAIVATLFRLTTYTNEPERASAGAALAQLRTALRGVYYLDGGWGTLVEGLAAAATGAGARIVRGAGVGQIERDHDQRVRGARLADGSLHEANAVLLAVGPREADTLLGDGGPSAPRWAEAALPGRAAALDLALRALPRPRARALLGIDQPLYLSVISATAKVAPTGGALIQSIKYLRSADVNDPRADERDLENLMDRVQPGWREVLVYRRFLPHLTVTNAVPLAATGGLSGRPTAAVSAIPGLFLAGDWVGGEGMLVDAALASARRAAREILRAGAAGDRTDAARGRAFAVTGNV